MTLTKDTNPKDAIGAWKWRHFTSIPFTVMTYLGVAMLEGAIKYRRHNYRISGVRASVYVDAALGHIIQFWEGEDIDEDSQNYHVIKAMASLAVLADAIIEEKMIDDRPPKAQLDKVRTHLQAMMDKLKERQDEALHPHTELGIYDEDPSDQKAWNAPDENPARVLEAVAEVIAEEVGLEVDHESFDEAAEDLAQFTTTRKVDGARIVQKPGEKPFVLERAVERIKGKGGVTLAGMPEKQGD